jgi:Flp pilus assembly pilin Flp
MHHFVSDETGATAIEYAFICALVVLACVAGFTLLGSGSNGLWSKVNTNVSTKL